MRCAMCNKTEEEAELLDGIFQAQITKICKECADSEGIPLLEKPTPEQLKTAEYRHSVRERMEMLSGRPKPEKISRDQTIVHKNLANLRMPPKKQFNEKLIDNYYWELNMARRRKKLTLNQLSQQTGIPVEVIDGLEKAQLPENFESFIAHLESALDVRLLKDREAKINFIFHKDEEKEIIKQVKEKIAVSTEEIIKEVEEKSEESKEELKQKIAKGEIDFSKKEEIKDITLADLQNRKKEKDLKKLLGDDIDLDVEEG